MQIVDRIWVPSSIHDKDIAQLNAALNEYDERLVFGRNEANGDWCVFIKQEHGEPPIAVLGFQDTVPSVEDMLERLRAADMRRHGDSILNNMNKHNADLKRANEREAEEAEWALAEGMESFLQNIGRTPYKRLFNKATESKRSGGERART